MANANPSGLGYAVPAGARAPEPNFPNGTDIVRLKDGKVAKRTLMANGNVMDNFVFAGDYADSSILTEAQWKAKYFPAKKAAAKGE